MLRPTIKQFLLLISLVSIFLTLQNARAEFEACLSSHSSGESLENAISVLLPAIRAVMTSPDMDYGEHVKLDESCLAKSGARSIRQTFDKAMRRGTSCMLEGQSSSAQALVGKITTLLTNGDHPFTISCLDTEFKTGETVNAKSFTEKDPKFPGLILNPRLQMTDSLAFEGTLFHETLHEVGITHGSSIELPHTCDVCCFDYGHGLVTPDTKTAACRICRGTYEKFSLPYLNDMYLLVKNTGSEEIETIWEQSVLNYIMENPANLSGYELLTRSLDNSDSKDAESLRGLEPVLLSGVIQFIRESFPSPNTLDASVLKNLENILNKNHVSASNQRFGLLVIRMFSAVKNNDLNSASKHLHDLKEEPLYKSMIRDKGVNNLRYRPAVLRILIQSMVEYKEKVDAEK